MRSRHPAAAARALPAVLGFTLLSYPLGLVLGQAWLVPLLNTLPAYALMVALLRGGCRRAAVLAMLAWAAALGAGGTLTFALWPEDPGALVLNGPAYRDEMRAWIETGVGREGSPRAFLPQHLGHLGAFVALSLSSASALAMPLGAVLMNFMSYYVASLARAGGDPVGVLLWGWQPWALCRVAAFCTLGVALAEPLLARLRVCPREPGARLYLWAAACGIAADWVLKALLAPLWRERLVALLE